MKFSEEELKAIQHPTSPNHELSATYSICLIMENDSRVYHEVNRRRRVDGTVSVQDLKAVHERFKFEPDEWALGEINYDVLAENFNMDAEPAPVSDTIRMALESIKIDGQVATLAYQLSQSEYPKVNKIIEALGGKWSRKAGGHVFTDKDPEERIANYLITGKLEKPEKFGFFPTPNVLAKELVLSAGLEPGDSVLEPESGVGNIAIVCAGIVGVDNVRCYELQAANCRKLRELGFQVTEADFLAIEPPEDPNDLVSAVVMNPPFERQADIDHVEHALKFLAPGGKFAAIMSQSITFRSNAKTTRFRQFLEKVGATIKVNDPNAFRESGTLARTVSITFRKPMEAVSPVRTARPAAPAPQLRVGTSAILAEPLPLPQRTQVPVQSAFAF
jgi:predicted RNA methylase